MAAAHFDLSAYNEIQFLMQWLDKGFALVKPLHRFQTKDFLMSENTGELSLPELEGITPPSALEFHLHKELEDLMYEETDLNTGNQTTKLQEIEKNFLESFSVAWERGINVAQAKGEATDFSTCSDRNLLVTISTKEEGRWVFEDINPDIIACQIAAQIRNSKFDLIISPLELLSIGIEIGQLSVQNLSKK